MITRRDATVAVIGGFLALGVMKVSGEKPPVLGSTAFAWNSVSAKATPVGSVRQFMRTPTATLDELELHVTTLNPGEASHAPHTHPNEELIIVKEGAVEALVKGEWVRLGSGSVIFNATNELHGLRSVGTVPAVYHVINWRALGTAAVHP